jgi:biotin carboxyl carrier protein
MSSLETRVGKWSLKWLNVPRGTEGSAEVEITHADSMSHPPKKVAVTWRRDADGIRLNLADGVHGFDLQGYKDDEGRTLMSLTKRGSALEWSGVSFTYGNQEAHSGTRSSSKKGARLRAQMPGKILRIMVKPGQSVEKGQPILLMEAMKMENEIRATQNGKVGQVKVTEGQAVETGADLVLFEI